MSNQSNPSTNPISTLNSNSISTRKKFLVFSLALNLLLTFLYVTVFTENNESSAKQHSTINDYHQQQSTTTSTSSSTTTSTSTSHTLLLSLEREDEMLNERQNILWENIWYQNPIDPRSHCLRGPLLALEDDVESVFLKILEKVKRKITQPQFLIIIFNSHHLIHII